MKQAARRPPFYIFSAVDVFSIEIPADRRHRGLIAIMNGTITIRDRFLEWSRLYRRRSSAKSRNVTNFRCASFRKSRVSVDLRRRRDLHHTVGRGGTVDLSALD